MIRGTLEKLHINPTDQFWGEYCWRSVRMRISATNVDTGLRSFGIRLILLGLIKHYDGF